MNRYRRPLFIGTTGRYLYVPQAVINRHPQTVINRYPQAVINRYHKPQKTSQSKQLKGGFDVTAVSWDESLGGFFFSARLAELLLDKVDTKPCLISLA